MLSPPELEAEEDGAGPVPPEGGVTGVGAGTGGGDVQLAGGCGGQSHPCGQYGGGGGGHGSVAG